MTQSPLPEYRPFPDVARRNFLQETLEVPILARLLALPRGGRVLEVGCGRGVALPVLARLLEPARLVGLDLDPDLLSVAEARARRAAVPVELVHGDVRALPFDDAAFDLVIDFGTCHHIRAPETALREIERVLAPGGLFVCESVTSQLLSHPFRTRGRRLPWAAVPSLRVQRDAVLWKSRCKMA